MAQTKPNHYPWISVDVNVILKMCVIESIPNHVLLYLCYSLAQGDQSYHSCFSITYIPIPCFALSSNVLVPNFRKYTFLGFTLV
jgi:hypothetical protein